MKVQSCIMFPCNRDERKVTREIVSLPKGYLTHITVMFLSGNGGLTHFEIIHNNHRFYPTSSKDRLDVKRRVEIDTEGYILPDDNNLVRLEGYNDAENEISRVKVNFVVLPISDSFRDSTIPIGGK